MFNAIILVLEVLNVSAGEVGWSGGPGARFIFSKKSSGGTSLCVTNTSFEHNISWRGASRPLGRCTKGWGGEGGEGAT